MNVKALVFGTLFTLATAGTALAQYRPGPPPPPPGQDPWAYQGGRPGNWDASWDRRPDPRRGACFFTDANFRGHRFCVRSGDRLNMLPPGYGHSISSIRTFGGASVTAFARPDFQGQRVNFSNMPDLGYTSNGPRRGWNDRISSIVVR